jgi:drug/metabolite transporter (DMT)-like permease
MILSLIWGSSFILMKKGMLSYSPSQVASMRVFFAGLVFVPILIKQFRNIPWNKFWWIILFALLELGIPPFLYTFAQTRVDSSSAGILNSLVPLFTLLTGIFMFKHRFHWLTTSGVFVGLLGAFLMTYFKNLSIGDTTFDLSNSFGLLIVLATLMYGLAGNILKEHLSEIPSMLLSSIAFVSLSLPAGIYLFSTNFISIPLSDNQNFLSLIYIVLLAVFGSALAIVLFSKLIQKSNALFASFVTYLIPFVSLLWGWLDGEIISLVHIFSLLIIFFGIYLANFGEKIEKYN